MLFSLDPLPYLAGGPGGLDEFQPVLTRLLAGGGDDLDNITAVQFGLQGNQFTVDPSPTAVIAHISMHTVGKINGCGPPRESFNGALGSEHINFIGKQVVIESLQQAQLIAVLLLSP